MPDRARPGGPEPGGREPGGPEPGGREPGGPNPGGREPDGPGLDAEDVKIVMLARASRARAGAAEGAAVRDTDGRTYTAVTVTLPSLALSALQLAVAMAVASGAHRLEAAAVVTPATEVDPPGLAAVRDLAPDAPVLVANPAGTVLVTVTG